jgi:hypothetical protein
MPDIPHKHVSVRTGEHMTHAHPDPDNEHGNWVPVYNEAPTSLKGNNMWSWLSPNGVVHGVTDDNKCVTCGHTHTRRVYCTNPEHKDGEHTAACTPPAEPCNKELRLIRAIFGLCPDCDRTSRHDHCYETALERWEAYWCGADVTLPTQEELDEEEDLRRERQYISRHSWDVDGYADNE